MNAVPAALSFDAASLEVFLLGMVDFNAALELQEQLVHQVAGQNHHGGMLLLCEHPPVLTVGREGSSSHIRCEPGELTARQLQVHWLNRGGGCLVHTPGQLAIYPILPLDRLGWGLANFRWVLEATLMDVCRELRVPAYRRADLPGVWSRNGQVGHLGTAVKSWVSWQGMFLNVSPALDWQRLVESSPADPRVTSLSAELVRPVAMHSVRESVIRNLAARAGYDRYHLYTRHPLLRRTRKLVAYA